MIKDLTSYVYNGSSCPEETQISNCVLAAIQRGRYWGKIVNVQASVFKIHQNEQYYIFELCYEWDFKP